MTAPLLSLAGLYRAKLSPTSSDDCLLTKFTVLNELKSPCCDEGMSLEAKQSPLEPVLNNFVSSFISQGRRMKQSISKYNSEKTTSKAVSNSGTDERSGLQDYAFITSNGSSFDRKALFPVSPHGCFLQVPTPTYVSFCHSRSQRSTTEPKCTLLGPCAYTDGVFFSSEVPNTPHELYGFCFILNGRIFADPAEKDSEHIVLCVLGSQPDFEFAKQLVEMMASTIHGIASDLFVKASLGLDATLRSYWTGLSDLLDANSDASKSFPGLNIEVPLLKKDRFADLRRPGSLFYRMKDTPLSTLLLSFNYNAVRLLHSLLLQEMRVIFIGCSAQHASACAVSAPSLVAPLKWVAPLIPYLSAEGPQTFHILQELCSPFQISRTSNRDAERSPVAYSETSCGFIIGATGDIIPSLLLRYYEKLEASVSPFPANHIWIADARTGNVGPLSQEFFSTAQPQARGITLTVPCVSLVPLSDKLQNAVTGAVNTQQRKAFRSCVSFFCKAYKLPTLLEEEEFYWKQLMENRAEKVDGSVKCGSASEIIRELEDAPYSIPVVVETVVLDVHAAFLEFNTHRVCGEYRKGLTKVSSSAAKLSETTHRFLPNSYLTSQLHSCDLALMVADTHMFKQFFGAIMCLESHGVKEVLTGRLKLSRLQHPWLRSASMVADLCLFYSRARNRFPDSYSDLSGAILPQWCLLQVNSALHPECEGNDVGWKAGLVKPFIVSLAGTASDGSNETKSGVLKFFSKASKAVRNFQNGEQHFVVPSPYIQSASSFRAPTDDSSNTPEFEFCEIMSDKPKASGTTYSLLPAARRLPFDAVHNFNRYHSILKPAKKGSNAAASSPSSNKTISLTKVGGMLPCSRRIWRIVEMALLEQSNITSKIRNVSESESSKKLPEVSADNQSAATSSDEECVLKSPPSISDIFDGTGNSSDFTSGMPDGFTTGVPDGFSTGIPDDVFSCQHADPNQL